MNNVLVLAHSVPVRVSTPGAVPWPHPGRTPRTRCCTARRCAPTRARFDAHCCNPCTLPRALPCTTPACVSMPGAAPCPHPGARAAAPPTHGPMSARRAVRGFGFVARHRVPPPRAFRRPLPRPGRTPRTLPWACTGVASSPAAAAWVSTPAAPGTLHGFRHLAPHPVPPAPALMSRPPGAAAALGLQARFRVWATPNIVALLYIYLMPVWCRGKYVCLFFT